jgi:hypothetical protein
MTKSRQNVFETNSSSVHTLTVSDVESTHDAIPDTIYLGVNTYGWGYYELTTPLEKLDYLAIETQDNEIKRHLLDEAIAEMFPNVTVVYQYDGYIDHQSYNNIWENISCVEDIKNIVLKDYVITITNDN